MDSVGNFPRSFDESLTRELPQLQSLRIAPLRQPASSRILSIPSPLEPNASSFRESNSISKGNSSAGILPARNNDSSGRTTETSNPGRSKKNDPSVDMLLSLEPPPKPILPSFVNLRALERFPYSSFDDDSSHARKRRRLELQTDSFSDHLQLPIPQSQKEQRPPPFGPFAILNGLNEPPPNAALLPPIEAGSITQLLTIPSRDYSYVEPTLLTSNYTTDSQSAERREGRIEEILDPPIVEKTTAGGDRDLESSFEDDIAIDSIEHQEDEIDASKGHQASTKENIEPLPPKSRGRSRRNLRKWTEEETTALIHGVVKCGIGNWTAILAQPELKFNKRSASNLKDRFRVCCPWAYRAADPNEATKKLRDSLADAMLRAEAEGSRDIAGKIRLLNLRSTNLESPSAEGSSSKSLDKPSSFSRSSLAEAEQDSSTSSGFKPNPSAGNAVNLSNRSNSTLASLGIPEPHFTMKSRRRSRHPFTAAEDEALLKGYAVHGFQWTLIQQDKRLNLSHRRATDLRDRFRTKFPHAYRDGGSVSGKTIPDQPQDTGFKDGKKKRSSQSSKQSSTVGRTSKVGAEQPTRGPINLTFSPPAPPQGLPDGPTGAPATVFQFSLDDNPASAPEVDASWADNTLAPMLWDELT
ncbi:hypothetical protein EYZ11_010826 [Aspergillus tanneri]|uniref:Myb-like domain-containing protein n=1 Tax=Aspergillus tanneri TaxID=1220188 RepID=A0A4S3J4C2_9EURO|nr:uncharacterized protein ATNIH1004_007132 [Aspergillus tanneri]KAA8645713.1 hypothetical protein ATNIH1004_007132 [Aspergillus tanneri]THC89723.1 hypothetical protein EYZ11_010826 [Aspergillus tanneri]